jgi:diguanylate cyclase (GGDEF)-like protein/PAS domain S-box-containing protein
MFDQHSAAILLSDPLTGKILDANQAACGFYGYTREEMRGMCMDKLSPPFKDEMQKRHLAQENREHRYCLLPHRLKSGETRMVDVYSSPVCYEGKTLCYSIVFDVTSREKYKEDLRREKELLNITLHSIGDGVVTTDRAGRITSLNPAGQRIVAWGEEDARGHSFSEVFCLKDEETGKMLEDPIVRAMETGAIVGLSERTVLVTPQEEEVPIADSTAPIMNDEGEVFGAVMVFRDVRLEREQQKQILYLSYHDALTGLYNRRFVMEELKRLEASSQLPLSIVIGDVNGLKLTNDAFGHAKGDKLLKKVAEAFRASYRPGDVIARWGGDEFLILLPNTSMETAKRLVRQSKSAFERKSKWTLPISVSLGYATRERQEEKLADVLKEAEKWMYHKKLLEGKSYRSTIVNTLLATLNEKSIETQEHSRRLEGYCQAMGKKLNLSAEELNELPLLAVLHDIGKIGIHQEVLQKPGELSPGEWEEVERHPEIGYRITKNIPELSMVADYILLHHERWDGTGYPKGYKGEEIPLPCRILAVADTYDVMMHGRVYKQAISKEEAIAELKRCAGKAFDPRIVKLFVKMITDKSDAKETRLFA